MISGYSLFDGQNHFLFFSSNQYYATTSILFGTNITISRYSVKHISPDLFKDLNEFKIRQEKFEQIRAEGEEKINNSETGGIECVWISNKQKVIF